MSALLAGRPLPPPPLAIDWANSMPEDLGMMLNDRLGDCTCAAVYHAIQVWTFNAERAMETETDDCVLGLYEQACGYNPADPSTDQGGVEQSVLSFLLKTGAPVTSNPSGRHMIAAYCEVDTRNQEDICRTIADCGCAYIGFNVPDYAMSTVGALWDVRPGEPNIIGGHAVILVGYDAVGPTAITWGKRQKMTWAFFHQLTDEAYAIVDPAWITSTGSTPGGLTLADLQDAMAGVQAA